MRIDYFRTPTPHAFLPELMPASDYARLCFPEIAPREMGRIGRDIYFGEPEWDAVMADSVWARFAETFMSEAFVRRVIGLFADDIRSQECGLDPDKAYLLQRAETRAETEAPVLSETADPNALFVRFDLQAIGAEYDKSVHCDHLRRVVGGVLFLTSATDEGLEGGEFALYSDQAFNNDRCCHQPKLEESFRFEHNQGVLFLNSNTGFHGPTPIRSIKGMRKWIYYSISSARNIWTRAPLRRV